MACVLWVTWQLERPQNILPPSVSREPLGLPVSPIPQREASAWKGFPGSWLLGDIWLLSCVYSLPLQRDMNPSYGFSKPHSLQTQSLRSGLQLEGALANSEPERLAGCSLPVLPPQATGWQRRPGLGWLGGMGVGEGSRGFLSLRP